MKLPQGWMAEPQSDSSPRVFLVHTPCGQRSTRTYHPALDGSWIRSHTQNHVCPGASSDRTCSDDHIAQVHDPNRAGHSLHDGAEQTHG